MASHEMPWLEVTRLWLEYLELADPVRAPKIRKILKHAEQGRSQDGRRAVPSCGVLRAIEPTAAGTAATRWRLIN